MYSFASPNAETEERNTGREKEGKVKEKSDAATPPSRHCDLAGWFLSFSFSHVLFCPRKRKKKERERKREGERMIIVHFWPLLHRPAAAPRGKEEETH